MTEVGNDFDPNPDTAKAIFEIKDTQRLAILLAQKYAHRLKLNGVAKIIYAPRVADLEDDPRPYGPSAFVKPEAFIEEREIRISMPATAYPYETIYTEADPAIAALFVRIR